MSLLVNTPDSDNQLVRRERLDLGGYSDLGIRMRQTNISINAILLTMSTSGVMGSVDEVLKMGL